MGPVGAHVRISSGVWHIDRVHFNELIYGEKGGNFECFNCPLPPPDTFIPLLSRANFLQPQKATFNASYR